MKWPIPFFWLFVFLLALLLLTAGGRIAPQDEETSYRITANLVEYGSDAITTQWLRVEPLAFPDFLPHTRLREIWTTAAAPGRDGLRFPPHAPGQALTSVPLYLLGRLLSPGPVSTRSILLTHWTTSLANPIVIALTGWLVALFASRFGFSRRLSVGLGLAYPLCTMVFAYTGTYFSEIMVSALVLLGAYAAYRARDEHAPVLRWLLVSGAALALMILTRERSAIVLPAFLLYVLLTQRRSGWRGWAAFLAPLMVSAMFIALLNWVRYGSPLTSGYSLLQQATFSTPLPVGLYGLLFSPGKGLLFYNPILWVGFIGLFIMFRTRRAEAILFALVILAELLFFAMYEFWTGGWNWGPRYLLPAVPLLVLAAGEWLQVHPTRLRKLILSALCVTGFVLNLPAVLVDHSRYLVDFGERDPQHYLNRAILNLADSPLAQQWPMVFEVANLYTRPATWQAAQAAVTEQLNNYSGDGTLESLSTHALWFDEFFRLNTPDFWFIHLPLLGFSPIVVGLLALALLFLTIYSGWRVRRLFYTRT